MIPSAVREVAAFALVGALTAASGYATSLSCARDNFGPYPHRGQAQVEIFIEKVPGVRDDGTPLLPPPGQVGAVGDAATYGAAAWNGRACPNVPALAPSSQEPPSSPNYPRQLVIELVAAPVQGTAGSWEMARHVRNFETTTVSRVIVRGQCPPGESHINVYPCITMNDPSGAELPGKWIDYSHGGGIPFGEVMGHEFAHGLGLGHDACEMSIMLDPDPGPAITDEHCEMVSYLNCDPATLPPGEACPPDPHNRRSVTARVTNAAVNDKVYQPVEKLHDRASRPIESWHTT